MEYFATARTQSAIADGITLLLISALLTAVGALLVFDLFGFVSKNRITPTRRSIELRERWGLPDTSKLVGWGFLGVGAPLLVVSLVGEFLLLAR